MKTVKKLIVLLTALVMVASLSAPLSIEAASDKESEDTVTVSLFNIADWDYSERTGEYAGPMVDGKPDGMGVVELVNPMGQKYDLYASFNNGVLDGTTAVLFGDGASMVSRQHVYKNGKVTEFCEVYEESGLSVTSMWSATVIPQGTWKSIMSGSKTRSSIMMRLIPSTMTSEKR